MSTAPASFAPLMTAEEFAERPDPGYPEELVRGEIVPMSVPKPRHGQICGNAYYLVRQFADGQNLGHVLSNDSAVITQRGPDTVRGADVSFYSYAKVPRGPIPEGYLEAKPDLIVEVISPSDRWPKILAKVAEYLDAGVIVVVLLDDGSRSAQVFRPDAPNRTIGPDDVLTLPEVLPGFEVAVSRFFE